MSEEEKKVYMLVKAVIFHYHGLDEIEKLDLENTSERLNAADALEWALDFISKDYLSAFERARTYLNEIIGDYPDLEKEDTSHFIICFPPFWNQNHSQNFGVMKFLVDPNFHLDSRYS